MVSLLALGGASTYYYASSGGSSSAGNTVEFWCCSVVALFATALTLASVNYLLWRIWVSARARRKASGGGGAIGLPAPVPVLPTWCGFLGGHSLIIKPSKIVHQLEGWAVEFQGDFELYMFSRRVIVITRLPDILRIFALRLTKFTRSNATDQFYWAATEVGICPAMFFREGKEWGRSRRRISPNLSAHSMSGLLPTVAQIGERLCVKLAAHAEAGETVEVRKYFERFTHDVIALASFGIDVDSLNATEENPSHSFDAIEATVASLMALATKPMSILGWTTLSSALPWVRRTNHHSDRLRNVLQRAIDGVRRQSKKQSDAQAAPQTTKRVGGNKGGAAAHAPESDGKAPCGALLRKIVGKEPHNISKDRMVFSDEEVVREAKSLFIAGTESTALPLCWSLYYLIKHPEAFARCRAEGLRAAPDSDGMVSTSEQLSQLVFCAAVFKEAMRIKSVAPFLMYYCKEDFTTEDGLKYKKGTSFCLLTRHVSMSDEFFTRGADFVPERWIDAERDEALLGKGMDKSKSDVRHVEDAFLSFGAGPRVCPGRDVAKAEAALTIAAICARFDVALAPDQPDPPEETMTLTLGPKAVKLIFSKRRPSS